MSIDTKEIESKINSKPDNREKVSLLIQLAKDVLNVNSNRSVEIATRAYAISKTNNYSHDIVNTIVLLESLYYHTTYPVNFSDFINEAIDVSQKTADLNLLFKSFVAAGRFYDMTNKRDLSLQYFIKAKELMLRMNEVDNELSSRLFNSLGNLYFKLNDFENSVDYYKEALKCIGNSNHERRALVNANIAMSYASAKEFDNAIHTLLHSIEIQHSLKGNNYLVSDYNNLAGIYSLKGDYTAAIKNFNNSIDINTQKNLFRLADSYFGIADCCVELGNLDEARKYLDKANEISNAPELNNYILLDINMLYSKIFERLGDYQKAFYHSKNATSILLDAERKKQSEKIKQLESEAYKKDIEIERLKNVELKEANKEIIASINYASYLQSAFYPSVEKFVKILSNSFGVTNHKDIVTGDFFWIEEVGDKILVAAADCTGHGVPGAIMTIVNLNLLEDAVEKRKITDPSEILEDVHKSLINKLEQRKSLYTREIRDGMDIALCAFDFKSNVLEYAGANRPMYLIRDGALIEYTPTKASIGGYTPKNQIFENNTIPLLKNDMIYIFSDGYADQFGGEKNKKFTTKRFKELLLRIWDKPIVEQRKYLIRTLEDWTSGGRPQTDDILVIGIRV